MPAVRDDEPGAPSARFAAVLRARRIAAGLTQLELAARAGVGVRTVRELERARVHRPQRGTLELLANALGLSGTARDAFIGTVRPAEATIDIEPLRTPASVPPPEVTPFTGAGPGALMGWDPVVASGLAAGPGSAAAAGPGLAAGPDPVVGSGSAAAPGPVVASGPVAGSRPGASDPPIGHSEPAGGHPGGPRRGRPAGGRGDGPAGGRGDRPGGPRGDRPGETRQDRAVGLGGGRGAESRGRHETV